MLNQVANPGGALGKKPAHLLANAQELQRIVAELPKDNAFKALDEVAGWLEAAQAPGALSPDRLYEAACRLEEAARPHLHRLCHDYLHTSRLSRTEEHRLWTINHDFWMLLASTYDRCLTSFVASVKANDALRSALPAMCTRVIASLSAVLKWQQFHYGPAPDRIWGRLGNALLIAEAAGVATSAAAQEYKKAMIFHAASLDSLSPLEIELAERLIEHFLPGFVFTAEARHDCVYWVDLKLNQPPLRLARMPEQAAHSQRFYRPGAAHAELEKLLRNLEQGGEAPPDLDLGGQYFRRTLIPVLRHLTAYLAPVPPQRRHDRHRVKHKVTVLNGLINAFVAFSDEFGGRPMGLQMESWAVENVSRGGFGAIVPNAPADWLRVGALLALQPEGGNNWLLGIVRRYHRASDDEARVGIETVARRAFSVELKAPPESASYAAISGIPALLLENQGEPGEVRVVLPPASFDLRENLECAIDKARCQLSPLALSEHTADYELARYNLARLN